MRRKDREVAGPGGPTCHFGTVPRLPRCHQRPGIRRAVPCSAELWYGRPGRQSLTLYFHCAPVGTKLDLLRADPNVSFEADCPGTVSGGATSCTYGMNYRVSLAAGPSVLWKAGKS